MNPKKIREILFQVALIVSVLAFWFFIQLLKTNEPRPWKLSLILSSENMKETITGLLIAAAIVIPLRFLYLHFMKEKNGGNL